MANPVNFVYNGKLFTLSEEEIEAAYRYRDEQYKIQDAIARYNDMGHDANGEISEDDAAVIAERAECIMSKCDTYWEDYWSCFDTAIEEFLDQKNM